TAAGTYTAPRFTTARHRPARTRMEVIMSIDDILNSLPTKEDIANAIGRQGRHSSSTDVTSALGIFGTGVLLGAGLALLFAPKRGSELREDITQRLHELRKGASN